MGVYVKGLDMPHNCVECKLPYEICGYSHRTDIRLRHERHENCPLVEVKTPHGHLADVDAIDTSYSDPEVVETLREAPTIIEPEE